MHSEHKELFDNVHHRSHTRQDEAWTCPFLHDREQEPVLTQSQMRSMCDKKIQRGLKTDQTLVSNEYSAVNC